MGITTLLIQAFFDTVLMVFISMVVSIICGIPLGISLFSLSAKGLKPMPALYQMLSFLVNVVRSVPFIILMILMLPLTRFLIGSGIGTMASIIPLSLGGVLLTARVVEDTFYTIPKGLKEIGVSIGASNFQIATCILLSEAMPSIVSGLTLIAINLVGFSAMAGVIGGGGLGDLAIRYGYQRYDIVLMIWIVVILIAFVQAIQLFGDYLAHRLRR